MTSAEQNKHKRPASHGFATRAVWKITGDAVEWFPSIKQAAESVKGTSHVIGRVLSGKRKSAYRAKWKYDSDPQSIENEVWLDLPAILVGDTASYGTPGGQISTGRLQPSGYIAFHVASKSYLAHRLVALVFLDNPKNLPVVNHISGDKSDARASNLEWVTSAGNARHALDTGLRESFIAVLQMDLTGRPVASYPSILLAAKKTSVDASGISRASRGIMKTAGNFTWRPLYS